MKPLRNVLFALVLLLVWASVLPAEPIRVATYNLRNYLIMDRMVDGTWRPDYPKSEAAKAVVRQVIQSGAPDILALQEIGTIEFLEELQADLALEGLEYPYAILMEGADAVRHVAVLSKLPPMEVVQHADLEFKYMDRREFVRRGLLEVSFESKSGERFKLFVVHLKSRWTVDKADPESEQRRVREAAACRGRVIERTFDLGQPSFMIAGDFNDHRDSGALRRFQKRGDLKIGTFLAAQDSRGEVWTYYFEKRGEYSLIDGFIVSEAMGAVVKEGGGRIADPADAFIGSDHRMVSLDLIFPDVE